MKAINYFVFSYVQSCTQLTQLDTVAHGWTQLHIVGYSWTQEHKKDASFRMIQGSIEKYMRPSHYSHYPALRICRTLDQSPWNNDHVLVLPPASTVNANTGSVLSRVKRQAQDPPLPIQLSHRLPALVPESNIFLLGHFVSAMRFNIKKRHLPSMTKQTQAHYLYCYY